MSRLRLRAERETASGVSIISSSSPASPVDLRRMAIPYRLRFAAFILAWTWLATPGVHAQDMIPCTDLSLDALVHMCPDELRALYCAAKPGPIPEGCTDGRAFRHAGTCLAESSTKMTGLLWHGKEFDSCTCSLKNRWCLGITAVEAKVCYGESWLDGCPAIVMDYRGVSPVVWRHVRDELRQIGPCLYLGAMFQEKHGCPKFKMFFALEVPPCCPAPN